MIQEDVCQKVDLNYISISKKWSSKAIFLQQFRPKNASQFFDGLSIF